MLQKKAIPLKISLAVLHGAVGSASGCISRDRDFKSQAMGIRFEEIDHAIM